MLLCRVTFFPIKSTRKVATRCFKLSSLHRARATTAFRSWTYREPAVQPAPLAYKAITTGHEANFCFHPINWAKMVYTVKRPHDLAPELEKRELEHTPKLKNYIARNHRATLGHTLCLPRERVSGMVNTYSSSSGVKTYPSSFCWSHL